MSEAYEKAKGVGQRIFGSGVEMGRQFAESSGVPYILPLVGSIIGILLIAMIIIVVIQYRTKRPISTLKGPIELFNPKTPVIVDRPTVQKYMQSSYTLAMYLKIDAVPDMRVEATPLLTWPNSWNLNYNAAKETIDWQFIQTRDTEGNYDALMQVPIPKIPLQRWNQIVISFEGRTADIFCNGVLISSTTLDNLPPLSSSSITIIPNNVIGKIAYIQAWPRRLTMGEISSNYVDTSDSRGRPYLGPEFFRVLEDISIPNLFCPGGSCAGDEAPASSTQKWEFPYQ
jgi:hypothetical protein